MVSEPVHQFRASIAGGVDHVASLEESLSATKTGKPLCDVLVLDGRLRQSLATVRSLGRRGIRVAVLESAVDAPAFSSRWCRQKFVCAAEEGSQEYLDFLMQVLDATSARIVISSSDGTIELLRRHRQELEQKVRLALAKEPALGIAIDKVQTLDIARRLGLMVPRGVLVSKVSEVQAALHEIGLPAVVKPTTSWTSNEQQGARLASRLVTTADEAHRAVEELTCFGGRTLFQQFLSGRCEAISFFYVDGEIIARFAYWPKRTDPPLGGTDVLGQSIAFPADTGGLAERLIREIELEGYALVEFRRDSSGCPYLMEINSRLTAGIAHAVHAGIDFPYLLFRWANGEKIEAVKSYRVGIWMRYLNGDIATTAASLRQRGRPGVNPPARAILDFITSFFVPAYYDNLDWRDLFPTWTATVGWFRSLPQLLCRAFSQSMVPHVPQAQVWKHPAIPMIRHQGRQEKEEILSSPMLRRLELALAACLCYSGIVKLARWYTRKQGQRLVVLCYHRAEGGFLRQHLLYLRRHYRILHLEAALGALYEPQKGALQGRKQPTLLALTFDDGYQDNYTQAFALAEELGVPITIFLVPGYIDSGNRFWWQEPHYLLHYAESGEVTIDGCTYHLGNADEKNSLEREIDKRLRSASSVEEREAFLAVVHEALQVSSSLAAEEKGGLPLNWKEIREMEESGVVSFDAHTMHHPILAYLADPKELQYEVSECRIVLERQLGHSVRAFAYPVGKEEHIGECGLAAVRAANYDWALTAMHGINTPETDPQLLHRIVVDVDQHRLMVAAKSCGVWDFLLKLCCTPGIIVRRIFGQHPRSVTSAPNLLLGTAYTGK
jgi:predicted ATP-grasp superfamily ATP-dependent carboligase/peptidoglycan/xylan/chitin deacetylase (PgdA/CDA1 family)